LYHSEALAERIEEAIADRLGETPRHEQSEAMVSQLIVARLYHDQCTISLDASGELLHRRGYRLETAKAPLRETLAAGMLMASGWKAESPLVDPFCGSGTIPIEAALLAGRIAPGLSRRFSFMDWPDFDPVLWGRLLAEAQTAQRAFPGSGQVLPLIFASDRDAGAVRMAQANAGRAGVADRIEFTCQAVSAVEPAAERGWIVTNPPYGKRVSKEKDLRNLYAQLGHVMRQKFPGWRFAILCSDLRLFGHSRLPCAYSLPLMNGGTPVRLYCGDVPVD
jgi:putative N6-adenine-specific DNA methylase